MAQGKDLGALIGQIGADIREWEKAADKMEKDIKDIQSQGQKMERSFSQSLDAVGKKMQATGKKMSFAITAPLAAMGGLAVREFGNFDAAMTKSTAIMGDVSDALRNDMERAAREVGKTMTLSAEEAADSYFFLASAGLDAEQSIAALPQVAQFAQAGMFDMATATDLATDAQSALGLTVDDSAENLDNLTHVTDVLVKANKLANASVEQFSTSLTREAGSALKSFDKDIEEGVAVLAAFADQGIKGERAGMGLSRILRLMTQAANNNKKELKALGLEVFDSEGKMRNLADIVENLETSLHGMSDQQRTSALESIGFTARVQGMILPLLGTSDAIREYEKELRNAGGTTEEVADRQLKGFNEALGLLGDNIRDIGISFGQSLEPVIRSLVGQASKLADRIGEMNEASRAATIVIGALAAALGPVLWALGSMARSISALIPIVSKLITVVKGLNLAMLANPYVAVAAGVAAIGAAAWTARKRLQDFNESIENVLEADLSSLTLDQINEQITAVSRKLESTPKFKPRSGLKTQRFTELEKVLESLIDKRNNLATKDLDIKISKKTTDRLLQAAEAVQTFINADFSSFKVPNIPDAPARPRIGATRRSDDDAIIDPIAIENMRLARQEFQQFQRSLFTNEDLLPDFNHRLDETGEIAFETSNALGFANQISDQFTSSFGQGLTNVLIQGEKVIDMLKNIGRLLASSVIQTAISALLTGGLGGTGFFGSGGGLFGRIFNDVLITSSGEAIGFHPDDNILAMKDFSDLGVNSGAANVSIRNVLTLDGLTVWKNQKNVSHRRSR